MSANDWPRGCLGFAVNLARPVHKARRAWQVAAASHADLSLFCLTYDERSCEEAVHDR